jgi:thiol-disulfide isomerase/thioredoxin
MRLKRATEAEPLLRQALGQGRTESRLRHLAGARRGLRRTEDAAALESEANVFLTELLKGKFIDEQFAGLRLQPFEGHPFNLSSLKGKVVSINFWATWCVPRAAERPALQKLYRKYGERGFEVIAASIDEDESKARSSAMVGGFDLSVMSPPELRKEFGVESVPASLFIDKHSRLRYRKISYKEGTSASLRPSFLSCKYGCSHQSNYCNFIGADCHCVAVLSPRYVNRA